MESQPLVTVGIPVRNGLPLLKRALEAIAGQSHARLEILIADNASTDGTSELCRDWAAKDSRIRYFRHEEPLHVMANFKFLTRQARGRFFMFHSHDDLRTSNYVETCLRGFDKNPGAVLVNSEVVRVLGDHDRGPFYRMDPGLHLNGLPLVEVMRELCRTAYMQTYGLFRTEVLQDIVFDTRLSYGNDYLLALSARRRGVFAYEPGATFYYLRPADETARDVREESLYCYLAPPPVFPELKLCWYVVRDVLPGPVLSRYGYWLPVYLWCRLKPRIYAASPESLRGLWKRIKAGAGGGLGTGIFKRF